MFFRPRIERTQRGPTLEELGTCPPLMVMADPYPCRRVRKPAARGTPQAYQSALGELHNRNVPPTATFGSGGCASTDQDSHGVLGVNSFSWTLHLRRFTMPRSHPPYPIGFREQMVELVRAGSQPRKTVLTNVTAQRKRSTIGRHRQAVDTGKCSSSGDGRPRIDATASPSAATAGGILAKAAA